MGFGTTLIAFCLAFVFSPVQCLNFVTCGSLLKLINVEYNARLHSHVMEYAGGSGMQSVTAVAAADDGNSLWVLKNKTGSDCPRGERILCNEVIRLEHLMTKKNLHSHGFKSPLSNKHQEIAAFGTNGEGDSGDNWSMECDTTFWHEDSTVRLLHIDTGVYLGISGQQYGDPIEGQYEVVGFARGSSKQWKAAEGVYIEYPTETIHKHYSRSRNINDEL